MRRERGDGCRSRRGWMFRGVFAGRRTRCVPVSRFRGLWSTGGFECGLGIHTGTPLLTGDGYVGLDVHRAARIAAAAHGGQVVFSSSTRSLVDEFPEAVRDLGEHRLKDLSAPERLFQLGAAEFPPLRSLPSTNLPVPATAFLGRSQELHGLIALLESRRSTAGHADRPRRNRQDPARLAGRRRGFRGLPGRCVVDASGLCSRSHLGPARACANAGCS